jgi:signal peptidase
MKKLIIIELLILLYVIFYQTVLNAYGEVMVYIINPLVWIAIAILSHAIFKEKEQQKAKYKVDILSIITILSLIYVIFFYLLGVLLGYTHNPYSTTISGIVINLFSVWLIACLKEYIRFILINIKLERHKIIILIVTFIIILISDINLTNIANENNLIDLWAKELIVPIVFNLLMMYLSYVSDYKPSIVSRTILILPSIFFSVVPDYEWFIIMSFDIVYTISAYLIIQYAIGRVRRDVPTRLINPLNPRRWIVMLILTMLIIAFGAGFFSMAPVVILTGSMEPSIKPGDLTIIRKCSIDEIKVGDVIEYQLEDFNVVHRVIGIYRYYEETLLITKGDANKSADPKPVQSDQILGKLEYTIPYLGYPAYLLKNIVNNNKEVDIEKGNDTSG